MQPSRSFATYWIRACFARARRCYVARETLRSHREVGSRPIWSSSPRCLQVFALLLQNQYPTVRHSSKRWRFEVSLFLKTTRNYKVECRMLLGTKANQLCIPGRRTEYSGTRICSATIFRIWLAHANSIILPVWPLRTHLTLLLRSFQPRVLH